MKIHIGICLALAIAACNWGTRPSMFPPAQHPDGAHAALRVRGETEDRLGELITVDSTGVVLREDDNRKMVRVPWDAIAALAVADASHDDELHPGERITAEKRARLALFSRFPQGIGGLPLPLDSFVARARTSTARFADRRVAVAEGYRRVGADFPGMGEHWIKPDLLLATTVDPSRPALLTYATIAGRPTLLGVGFMLVVHGDSVPSGVPGWPDEWHEHSGLLAEESAARGVASSGPNDTHVWVMHTWTVLGNPDGDFAADNWALPYVRAGLSVPPRIDPDASRALAVAADSGAFLRGALVDAGLRTEANGTEVDAAIASARTRAIVAARDPATATRGLHVVWNDLSTELERCAGPSVRGLMASSHSAHAGEHR